MPTHNSSASEPKKLPAFHAIDAKLSFRIHVPSVIGIDDQLNEDGKVVHRAAHHSPPSSSRKGLNEASAVGLIFNFQLVGHFRRRRKRDDGTLLRVKAGRPGRASAT